MDFNKKKQLVEKYLDKIYNQLESDLALCKKIEIIEDSFQIEYKKLCNYAVAIKDDLKNEAVDELEQKSQNKSERLSEKFDLIARSFKIPQAHIEDNNFFVMQTVNSTVKRDTVPSQNGATSTSSAILGVGIGAVLGGGVGAVLVKELVAILIGAAVGGVVGGVIGGAISNNVSNAEVKAVTAKSTAFKDQGTTTKKVSQEKINYFVQERNKKIKRLFLNYIDEFENVYNS
jgi:hypothetical protein